MEKSLPSLGKAFCGNENTCMEVSYLNQLSSKYPVHSIQYPTISVEIYSALSWSLPSLTCYASQREKQWECTVVQKRENSGSENTTPGVPGSVELFLRNCFPNWSDEVFPISSFGGRRLLAWSPFEELIHSHFRP